jgi:hypothetical protein
MALCHDRARELAIRSDSSAHADVRTSAHPCYAGDLPDMPDSVHSADAQPSRQVSTSANIPR